MKKVCIVNGNAEYRALFQSMGFAITDALLGADLVCFTGGADVTPAMYGDNQHHTTYNNSRRDEDEHQLFLIAQHQSIPMVGICRGAQFLNVMSGGRMYQHVEKHCVSHDITDLNTGESVFVTSTHHQMMMPSDKAKLIASSSLQGSREWFDGNVAKRDISNTDIEIVFYQHTNALCFQPHPEMYQNSDFYAPMRKYFSTLVNDYLGV